MDEVTLAGSAPGGKVEFKRTLIISFLFKFYLEVLQGLKREVSRRGPVNWNGRVPAPGMELLHHGR